MEGRGTTRETRGWAETETETEVLPGPAVLKVVEWRIHPDDYMLVILRKSVR